MPQLPRSHAENEQVRRDHDRQRDRQEQPEVAAVEAPAVLDQLAELAPARKVDARQPTPPAMSGSSRAWCTPNAPSVLPASRNTIAACPAVWSRLSTDDSPLSRYHGTCVGSASACSTPTAGTLCDVRPSVRPFSNALRRCRSSPLMSL